MKQVRSLNRHSRDCRVCSHPNRAEIELRFIGWDSPATVARENHFNVRTLFRHAHATNLFLKRDANIRAALSRIIEKGMSLRTVTAHAVVAAVAVFSKINANGRWIDRTETVNVGDLFERMSSVELEEYATTGTLPRWFEDTVGLTDTRNTSLENGGLIE